MVCKVMLNNTRRCRVTVLDDDLVLIPEGRYQARFLYHETCIRFGDPKIAYWCEILSSTHYGQKLARWYNCRAHDGRPARNGGFSVGKRHSLFRDFYRLFPEENGPPCPDRLLGQTLWVDVKTVKQGSNKKPIPRQSYYSVIRDILEIVE